MINTEKQIETVFLKSIGNCSSYEERYEKNC
jgi:hypothetical protein